MPATCFVFILFLVCYTQLCLTQPNDTEINYWLQMPANINPNTLMNNVTLVVEVEKEYSIDGTDYDFDTYEFYFYNNGEFVLDPYVNYTACDDDSRPEVCYDTFKPVCAYFASCTGGICAKTVSNECYACADTNVSWFIKGACEDIQTICPDSTIADCNSEYNPVCAIASNCSGDYCCTTVINSCQACNYPYIDYLLPGQCPNTTSTEWASILDLQSDSDSDDDDEEDEGDEEEEDGGEANSEIQISTINNTNIYCNNNNRPVLCTLDYFPVCAHQQDCYGPICSWTTGNLCTACHNTTIDYYVKGICPGELFPPATTNPTEVQKVLCDPNNRPFSCPLYFQPVCTFAFNCTGDDCNATTINPCVACSIINADYYLSGPCSEVDKNLI